jgi:hypothetical protein
MLIDYGATFKWVYGNYTRTHVPRVNAKRTPRPDSFKPEGVVPLASLVEDYVERQVS